MGTAVVATGSQGYARDYDWLTGGFDTRKVKDAKALLQELAL
jgi:hypothetical protein